MLSGEVAEVDAFAAPTATAFDAACARAAARRHPHYCRTTSHFLNTKKQFKTVLFYYTLLVSYFYRYKQTSLRIVL